MPKPPPSNGKVRYLQGAEIIRKPNVQAHRLRRDCDICLQQEV